MNWSGTMRWTFPLMILVVAVLVPFFMAGQLVEAQVDRMLSAPPSGVLSAVAIDGLLLLDVLLPIPSSLLLAASGWLFGVFVGTLVGWIGLSAGCVASYWIGANCGHWLLRPFVTGAEQQQAAAAVLRRGSLFLVLARPIPVLAETTTIMAGALRMPFGRFLLLTMTANLGIAAVYAVCGALALSEGSFLLALGFSVLLPGLALAVQRIWFTAR